MKKYYVWAICCLALLASCVEEYWPELEPKDDKLLVVEGFISNEAGPYTVKLSQSRSLDSIPNSVGGKYDFDAYENAIVTISDDLNNTETLTEVEPGIYQTSVGGIQGVIGRSYKLTVIGASGTEYESTYDELKQAVGIESVDYIEFTTKENESGWLFTVTTDEIDGSSYFKWDVTETYEYHSPHTPTHYFNGAFKDGMVGENGPINTGSYSTSEPYNLMELDYNIDSILFCWQTQYVNQHFIGSNEFTQERKLENMPLHFIKHEDVRIRVRYSILVEQSVISEEAHNFMQEIVEQNSHDEDDLYTKQPYQIRGNVKNTSNEDEAVLGVFYAKSILTKRLFTPPDNKPKHENAVKVEACRNVPTMSYNELTGEPVDIILTFLPELEDRPNLWPVYFGRGIVFDPRKEPRNYPEFFIGFNKSCIDCRYKGGVSEKPSFWHYD